MYNAILQDLMKFGEQNLLELLFLQGNHDIIFVIGRQKVNAHYEYKFNTMEKNINYAISVEIKLFVRYLAHGLH